MDRFIAIAVYCLVISVLGQDAPSVGIGTLPDDAFTASSTLNDQTLASRARLNLRGTASGWAPDPTDSDPWLQVDLGAEYILYNIGTQGRSDGVAMYTTRFEVETSNNGSEFTSTNKDYEGNRSKNRVKYNSLDQVRARYVRIKPTACQRTNGCAMRFDLFGYPDCTDSEFPSQFEDSCYQFLSEPANFSTQATICSQNGGYLASITRLDENDFVAQLAYSGEGGYIRTWLGGQKDEEGDFVWPSNEVFLFTNWREGKQQVEPNNWGGRENCIEINFVRHGLWNDHFCERTKPAVCEKA